MAISLPVTIGGFSAFQSSVYKQKHDIVHVYNKVRGQPLQLLESQFGLTQLEHNRNKNPFYG